MQAALGKRERELGGDSSLAPRERTLVRRQAAKVFAQSTAIAIGATAVVWLLSG